MNALLGNVNLITLRFIQSMPERLEDFNRQISFNPKNLKDPK